MKEDNPPVEDEVGLHTLQVLSKATRFNAWMYKSIKPYLKGNILEIGSGIGNISQFAIKDQHTVTLSDYNPEYCTYLKKKFKQFSNVQEILSIDLQHPDFYKEYRALKESFDTIYMLNVIEHLADDAKAVSFCHYLLKTNGHLIVLAPAYPFLFCRFDKKLGHYRRYSTKRLQQLLLGNRFSIQQKFYFNVTGLFGWFLFGKILGQKSIQKQEIGAFDMLVPITKYIDIFVAKRIGLSAIVIGIKN